MKWKGRRRSSNIEDRRGQSGSGGGRGINPLLLGPLIKLLFSKTGLVIIALFLGFSWFTGNNPLSLVGNLLGGGGSQSQSAVPYQGSSEENELAAFSATILGNTEDVRNSLIPNYREPTLVLLASSIYLSNLLFLKIVVGCK